jgi:hypothetical protein
LRWHRRLQGAFYWWKLRLNGSRCFACGRLLALHAPWQSYRCNRTPLPFEITDKGRALLAGDPMAVEPADDRLIVHL